MTSSRFALALGLTCSLSFAFAGCNDSSGKDSSGHASKKRAANGKKKRAGKSHTKSTSGRSRTPAGAPPPATPSAKKIFEAIDIDRDVVEIVRDPETARSFGEGAPLNPSDPELVHAAAKKTKAARSELAAHLSRHRRRPPSVTPQAASYLALVAVMDATSAAGSKRVPRERALARALSFAFQVAAVLVVEEALLIGKADDPESESGAIETTAYAVAWPFFESGKIPRTERTRLISSLARLDEVDTGATKDVSRNIRRAKRRVLSLGLRRSDKRMVPRLPDPFSSPNPLRTATDPGRVYSIGENRKDDVGHPAADIVLMLPEGAQR